MAIVTGGGPCPGLNAVIRSVVKAAAQRDWERIGIWGDYEGFLESRQSRLLDFNALSGSLTRGGMIPGMANRGKFSAKTGHGDHSELPKELLDGVKAGMEALGVSALVAIGGDGSLTIAQQMHEHGIPIVGVPKTIVTTWRARCSRSDLTRRLLAPRTRSIACTPPPKVIIGSWSWK